MLFNISLETDLTVYYYILLSDTEYDMYWNSLKLNKYFLITIINNYQRREEANRNSYLAVDLRQ